MVAAPAAEVMPLASVGSDSGRALRRLRVLLYLLNQGTKVDHLSRMRKIQSLHLDVLLWCEKIELEMSRRFGGRESGEFRNVVIPSR